MKNPYVLKLEHNKADGKFYPASDLTLRDLFAMQAMNAIISGSIAAGNIIPQVGDISYKLADEMLQARGTGDEKN